MIKVIASDMDGTLLCDDHRIAPDTIAAVKEACAAGIRFMVATGRGYEGAMAELDGTGIVCDYILGSGAEVRDPQRKIVKECGHRNGVVQRDLRRGERISDIDRISYK